MRVLVAPDSFKGSMSAGEVASAIVEGWRRVRPGDHTRVLPLADGGEGTLEAMAGSCPGAVLIPVSGVTGPTGLLIDAEYLMLADGTAVVELARSSGLPLADPPDPLNATTRGTGEVVLAALGGGATRIVLTLGGSASTDGGAGLLRALGMQITDAQGRKLGEGGGSLTRAASVDVSRMVPPPRRGVLVLTDVQNPLLGPDGAAAVYAPQKGATAAQVDLLEDALAVWARLSGGDDDVVGAGAAGGTAYGVMRWWSGQLLSGSDYLVEVGGLDAALADADLVLTGEGSFDGTSFNGKLCGQVLRRAAAGGVPAGVICGTFDSSDARVRGVPSLSLAHLAGSVGAAQADARAWATKCGEHAAQAWGQGPP